MYVAEEDGIVLGYAFCIFQQPHGENMYPRKSLYIDDLCVDQSCRGRGYGKALVAYGVNRLLKQGETPRLEALDWNKPALTLYRKMGFDLEQRRQLFRADL